MSQQLRGIMPSLTTPFTPDLEVDHKSLERVVRYAIDAGAHALVVMELQGEHFSLGDDERKKAVATVLKSAAGQVPVVVGVSAASQEQSVIFARHAEESGASALIATPPFFRAQSPQRIDAFYKLLNGATSLPVIAQSAPEGMGTAISVPQQMDIVRENQNVKYLLNECVANQMVITTLLEEAKSLRAGSLIAVGSGNGAMLMLHDYYRGARFFMPSVELTELYVDLWNALESGEESLAMKKYKILAPVMMFGSNYKRSFTKGMLKRRGIIEYTAVRETSKPVYDAIQEKELDYWHQTLQPLFRV